MKASVFNQVLAHAKKYDVPDEKVTAVCRQFEAAIADITCRVTDPVELTRQVAELLGQCFAQVLRLARQPFAAAVPFPLIDPGAPPMPVPPPSAN